MSNYIGMSFNDCHLMGRLKEDPSYFPLGDSEGAYLTLLTQVREMDVNGQWTENEIEIPLYILEATKVKVVKDYLKADSQIKIDAYFKTWVNDDNSPGYGMIVTKIKLGSKPRQREEEAVAAKGPSFPG